MKIAGHFADLSISRQKRAKITQVPVDTILSVLNLIPVLGAHPLPNYRHLDDSSTSNSPPPYPVQGRFWDIRPLQPPPSHRPPHRKKKTKTKTI